MKKYTIKHLLFLLLLVAMAGCTEDPISMAAGKLPDEVAMSKIGGILYSEKSLTNKLAIRLSKDETSATDAIYYTLTQPAASAVTVTAIADEKLVDIYNETNLTSLKALPAANVQFEKGGTLTIAAGKQLSEKTGIRSRNNISTSTHHSASTNRCTGSKRKTGALLWSKYQREAYDYLSVQSPNANSNAADATRFICCILC